MKSSVKTPVKMLGIKINEVTSKFNFTRKKVLVILVILVVCGFTVLSFKGQVISAFSQSSTSRKPGVSSPKSEGISTSAINKDFQFPVKDNKGEEITKLNYTIESGTLTKTIIVQGQQGTAAPGRQFIILNLKIRNDSNADVRINSRDYLRVSVTGGDDWLAADIHNDPVDVQPISTKFTRLGFPVDDSQRAFRIQVGEIGGSKTTIDLNFQK